MTSPPNKKWSRRLFFYSTVRMRRSWALTFPSPLYQVFSFTVTQSSLGFQTAYKIMSRPNALVWQSDQKTQTPTTGSYRQLRGALLSKVLPELTWWLPKCRFQFCRWRRLHWASTVETSTPQPENLPRKLETSSSHCSYTPTDRQWKKKKKKGWNKNISCWSKRKMVNSMVYISRWYTDSPQLIDFDLKRWLLSQFIDA